METNEIINNLDDTSVNMNDKRNIDIEDAPVTLYNAHYFTSDINTLVHYLDNCVSDNDSVMVNLIPTVSKRASGIVNYIYRHKGTIGAIVYVNGYFSAHIYHGTKPVGDKYMHFIGGGQGSHNNDNFYQGNQLEHFIDFHLDDDESKLTHIYLAPGMYDNIQKEIKESAGEEAAESADSYILDGLLSSIEAVIGVISDKEIENTFNKYKRIKRIDPFMTVRYDVEGQGEHREKIKITLDTFAVSEEQQRYVINVTTPSLEEWLMFNRLLVEIKPNTDKNSEGFIRVYDAKMIKTLADGTPDGYVLGVIETSNGNFNVNYDRSVFMGYSFKQTINSNTSYVVLMNKEDPSKGFENILVIYNDFGHTFTQPLSKENAEIVFKNLVSIRPNLHEDYVDKRTVKDVSEVKPFPRGMTDKIIMIDDSPFMQPIVDLEDD